jgi:hypothetical protein
MTVSLSIYIKKYLKWNLQILMRSLFCVMQCSFYMMNLFEKIYEVQFTLFIELFIWSRENEI